MDKLTLTFKFAIKAGWIDAHDCKAIRRALCMTGKRKGFLKKSPPNRYEDAEAYAAWQAIMPELCGSRVNVWGILSLPVQGRALLNRVRTWATYFHAFINADLQRPFEFNMYHLNKTEDEA